MHCYWEHTSGAPSFVDDFSKRPSWTHMQTLFNYGQCQYCPSTNCTVLVSVHLSGILHMFMKGDCLSNVLIKCWTNTSHGAKTINVFRACLGAQVTVCAQKWSNFVLFSMVSLRFVLSRVCVFLYSLGPWCWLSKAPVLKFRLRFDGRMLKTLSGSNRKT